MENSVLRKKAAGMRFNIVASRFSGSDLGKVRQAYQTAKRRHQGQERDEGEAYIVHPVRVAERLVEKAGVRDADLVCIALLHDVLEDSNIREETIRKKFGNKVLEGVKTLTVAREKRGKSKEDLAELKRQYFQNLRKAPKSIRLIKLCDRMDNMAYLHLSPDKTKREKYWQETKSIFLPMAKRTHSVFYGEMKRWLNWFEKKYLKK